MKRIIKFSRYFFFCGALSVVLIVSGIAGFAVRGGFNLGIDFQAGVSQEVQFAPRAFSLGYDGPGNALVSLDKTNTALVIAVSGVGVQGFTYQYLFSDYSTLGAFAQALNQIEGVSAAAAVPSSPFRLLVLDALTSPALGPDPYWVHYLPPDAGPVPIDGVREALKAFNDPSVQILRDPGERLFLIRIQETDVDGAESAAGAAAKASQLPDIRVALDTRFGEGETAVISSNYVGSGFSAALVNQAIILLAATLVLILLYASVRFKPQYAIGAVLAIAHDGLIIVAFVVWSRMEFNTTTIAAILTILGYSINDTIVIFDRMRENKRIYPGDSFEYILNRSLSETLGRTFITTMTTMLAVSSLYVFTAGAMKDFALALLVGLVAGVYSTIFIASSFVLFWERKIKPKRAGSPAEPKAEIEPSGA